MAAVALLVTLFLPWYGATIVERGIATTPTYNAFGEFSFVEAAVLLVAGGVFALLFARGERRGFHLPGGDGTVIFAAGLWAAVLLLWRVFDRPDVERAVNVGIQWGFFFAFLAAAALAAAGWRIRAAGRPEPPNPAADPADAPTVVAGSRRRTADPGDQLTLDDEAGAARVRERRRANPKRTRER
jgi:hypothetical protein